MRHSTILIAAAGSLALAACSPPKPPEEEHRPEPQTQPGITAQANVYKDAARDAATATEQAAAKEKAAIDAATR